MSGEFLSYQEPYGTYISHPSSHPTLPSSIPPSPSPSLSASSYSNPHPHRVDRVDQQDQQQQEEDPDLLRKRALLEEEAEREAKKNRGNYRCSKCGEPKKGHVCKFQPRYRRKEVGESESCNKEVQVELDSGMTIRTLQLDQQGYYESYLSIENFNRSNPPASSTLPSPPSPLVP